MPKTNHACLWFLGGIDRHYGQVYVYPHSRRANRKKDCAMFFEGRLLAIIADGRPYLFTQAPVPGFDTIHTLDCSPPPDPNLYGKVSATICHGGINPNGDKPSWVTLTAVLLSSGTLLHISPDLQVTKTVP